MSKTTSVVTAFMSVALATMLVLPRKGKNVIPVPTVIKELGSYMTGSIKSMLGTNVPTKSKQPKGKTQ